MINPYNIPKERMPLIVFSDHTSGFIQWLIKFRTNASYNHCMFLLYPGEFVSQGNVFSSIPLSRYVKKNSRLKFWAIKDLKNYERYKIYNMINKELKGSWWSRKYDYLGILGQILGIVKINMPGNMYCSERVSKYLRELEGFEDLPEHSSPKGLNEAFKKHLRMEVYGRWTSD
ncbi:MAG TPA: hypothetical protein ENL19_01825 [candidate division WOR-3 bacterium]|uniref:Uncharacterized protein n=1 Tax=candidate division WOR-3 bacterium TaxID=2052148 RepID=A0A7C5DAV0_UNCW3|nr:hypothetical protein [candidate division WOR-3 bacterium]